MQRAAHPPFALFSQGNGKSTGESAKPSKIAGPQHVQAGWRQSASQLHSWWLQQDFDALVHRACRRARFFAGKVSGLPAYVCCAGRTATAVNSNLQASSTGFLLKKGHQNDTITAHAHPIHCCGRCFICLHDRAASPPRMVEIRAGDVDEPVGHLCGDARNGLEESRECFSRL
jgi:hypothetical protein